MIINNRVKMTINNRERIKKLMLWVRKFIPFLPMRRLKINSHCVCEKEILKFDENSEHSVIIKRYVGGFGHLVDVYYHPKCYFHYENMLDPLKGEN